MGYYSYRLGDADRERLGCPEWLPVSLADCTLDDITYLSDRFVFELEDWPEVLLGDIPFEAAGTPEAESKRKPPKWGIQALLWLALHQADVPVTWEQVGKLQVLKVQRRLDDEEPGKQTAAPAESDPTSGPSTTPPSSTSTPA
jgi:hypothetical protein